MTEVALRLGDLIGVMRERIVHTAAVQVKILAVVLHGDAGALDMPAGIPHAPGRIPFERLILKLGLGEPKHEVVLVLLVGVLLHALAHADSEVFLIVVVEDVVTGNLAGVKIHVAAGKIGIALFDQRGDDMDIVVNETGGGLDDVRALDVELAAVVKERVGVELRDLHDGLMLAFGALEHLVLALVGVGGQMPDVGDVHHAVDVIARKAQVLFQHVLHDVGAEVADVCKVVHRRTAGIHLHMSGRMGLEFFFLMGGRVVKIHNEISLRKIILIQSASLNISMFLAKYSMPE